MPERHRRLGRNFEYLAEMPCLKLLNRLTSAKVMVTGIQSKANSLATKNELPMRLRALYGFQQLVLASSNTCGIGFKMRRGRQKRRRMRWKTDPSMKITSNIHLSCKAKHGFYEVSRLPRQELRRHDINILVPTLPQEISSHGKNWTWISIVSVPRDFR